MSPRLLTLTLTPLPSPDAETLNIEGTKSKGCKEHSSDIIPCTLRSRENSSVSQHLKLGVHGTF